MQHRHLNLKPSQQWSAPAVDDIIVRGSFGDWAALMQAVESDSTGKIAATIRRVSTAHPDAYEQSYRFFEVYLNARQGRFVGLSKEEKSFVAEALASELHIGSLNWSKSLIDFALSPNTMTKKELPDWEMVLSAAAKLQQVLPQAVLVGGTATAIHVKHRLSVDADHTLSDLRERFDQVLQQLESVAGWQTARIRRPVLILGSLDGIETGVRQLIRTRPLETEQMHVGGKIICLPTMEEMLRIKAVLVLKRNAARDYLDVAALSYGMGITRAVNALLPLDEYYPQMNEQSVRQQLLRQMAEPLPYDLEQTDLSEYKRLNSRWHNWDSVKLQCRLVTAALAQNAAALQQQNQQHNIQKSSDEGIEL